MWLGFLLVCIAVLTPAFLGLRRTRAARSERDSALALYRGQLAELDRDARNGLIGADERQAARLEIERRLLAADRLPVEGGAVEEGAAGDEARTETTPGHGRRAGSVAWVLVPIPVLAFALYLSNGHPSLPPQPMSARHTAEDARTDALIARLRNGLSTMPQDDPRAVQGYLLLGQAEAGRGHFAAAAMAWHRVLDRKFDPVLALQIAEAQTRAQGHVGPDSLSLYRQAIAAVPQDAPYRMSIEARIAEGEHDASAAR